MKRLLLLMMLGTAGPASAATYCIPSGDLTAFSQALIDAQANGQDDLIRLQAGRFDLTASLLHASAESNSLAIEGGYSDFFGDPCGLAPTTPDASRTVVDGGLSFRFSAQLANGNLQVEGLTLAGMSTGIGNLFAAVEFEGKDVVVVNAIFAGNLAFDVESVLLRADGAAQVQNSLFYENATLSGRAAIGVENAEVSAPICNAVVNNTIANNFSSLSALSLRNADPACPSIVANSVFWGNGSNDLSISTETFLSNNDMTSIHVVVGPVHPDLQSFSADPMFRDSANGDYSVRDESPLRDRGNAGGFVWTPGDWDVIGNPRTYNGTPDIGAFEIDDVIFASGVDTAGLPQAP